MVNVPFELHELDNGLRVVLSPDPGRAVVTVNLWYGVGSRDERTGRTGFAHLFEHMMFQGSAHVPDTAHFAFVEQAGGSANGSTWLDRTNYYETLPSHHLELALWLEADRMGWLLPAMTKDKLDNQRDVVKNERRWRVDNQPYGDWDERLQAMIYPADHPYHHSVIGSMEDLDAASLEDVEQFFRTYYVPNNAVLSVCGGFDDARVLGLVERYFAEIPRGAAVPPLPGRTEVDPLLGGELREEVSQDITLPRIFVAYRIPAYGEVGFYPAAIAAHILARGKASRLYRRLVREMRLAQDVAAFPFPLVVGAGMLVVWATARPDVATDVLEAALHEEIEALQSIDAAEVERAVNMIEASHLIALQRTDERADQLSMFTTLFGEPERINTELTRFRGVVPGSVHEFARSRLRPDNRAVLQYVPRNGGVSP